jgi:hypothetical protein
MTAERYVRMFAGAVGDQGLCCCQSKTDSPSSERG